MKTAYFVSFRFAKYSKPFELCMVHITKLYPKTEIPYTRTAYPYQYPSP